MKRTTYILAFTFFGVLVQFLLHALLEIWYISLLLTNFPVYSLGFSWRQWEIIHHIFATILLLLGTWLGYRQGVYWWHRLYVLGLRWKK